MKPKSKQKRVVVWLGPAFEGDIETLFATPQGYQLLETKPGRESKNGQRKVTLIYQLVDHRRRVVCKRCGVVLVDTEPNAPKPDYHHPKGSTCELAGCYPPPESYKVFYPKSVRRARKRGAKLGGKMARRARRG